MRLLAFRKRLEIIKKMKGGAALQPEEADRQL